MDIVKLYNQGIFEEILNHSNDGFNIVDKDGIVIYANKMSAEYANTDVYHMIGKHITLFYD